MPIISTFFGIVIRMFYDDHNPPHIHVEYQSKKALLDFRGNILKGDLAIADSLEACTGMDRPETCRTCRGLEFSRTGEKAPEN